MKHKLPGSTNSHQTQLIYKYDIKGFLHNYLYNIMGDTLHLYPGVKHSALIYNFTREITKLRWKCFIQNLPIQLSVKHSRLSA